jgi:hypothetical protein
VSYRERGSCYRNRGGEQIIRVTIASVCKAKETTEPKQARASEGARHADGLTWTTLNQNFEIKP